MTRRIGRANRDAVLETYRALYARGLSRGTSGNVSARYEDGMLITASGVHLEDLALEDVVFVAADGEVSGKRRPSSEAPMHAAIYAARGDVGGIVHCHSRFATILACARRSLPPLHYMVGVTGRNEVPCVGYATFGSAALAHHVVRGLDGGKACLMANHGQVAVGRTLREALAIAEEVEEQAAVYVGALQIGGPTLLDESEMAAVFRQFAGYGQNSGND